MFRPPRDFLFSTNAAENQPLNTRGLNTRSSRSITSAKLVLIAYRVEYTSRQFLFRSIHLADSISSRASLPSLSLRIFARPISPISLSRITSSVILSNRTLTLFINVSLDGASDSSNTTADAACLATLRD